MGFGLELGVKRVGVVDGGSKIVLNRKVETKSLNVWDVLLGDLNVVVLIYDSAMFFNGAVRVLVN